MMRGRWRMNMMEGEDDDEDVVKRCGGGKKDER